MRPVITQQMFSVSLNRCVTELGSMSLSCSGATEARDDGRATLVANTIDGRSLARVVSRGAPTIPNCQHKRTSVYSALMQAGRS